MGRQTHFFAFGDDERMLLTYAFGLGAVLVCWPVVGGKPRLLCDMTTYDALSLFAQTFLWLPAVSELKWHPESGMVKANESDTIEYCRSYITSEGFLLGGRLYLQPEKLVFCDRQPQLVPRDGRVLTLYASLVGFVKKEFSPYRQQGGGTVYIGPDALEWYRQGGRLRSVGNFEDEVIDLSKLRRGRR